MNKAILLKKNNEDNAAIAKAASALKASGVVIFPTDTVYGIGAVPTDKDAIAKIYALKGRDFKKPLALLVADEKIVYNLSDNVPKKAAIFMKNFWPGALTIVIKQKNGETLGFRMPNDETALNIITESGRSLAVTSVNKSGQSDALNITEIEPSIFEGADLVLDGGQCLIQQPSTVIMFENENEYTILRQGSITKQQLEEAF